MNKRNWQKAIHIPRVMHRELKVIAALRGVTMTEVLEEILEQGILQRRPHFKEEMRRAEAEEQQIGALIAPLEVRLTEILSGGEVERTDAPPSVEEAPSAAPPTAPCSCADLEQHNALYWRGLCPVEREPVERGDADFGAAGAAQEVSDADDVADDDAVAAASPAAAQAVAAGGAPEEP